MKNSPITENRIWAVISHLAALTLGMGVLLPVIGWSDQRRKSNYAAFQTLQALGYQSLGYTIWLLSYLVIIIVASIIVIATVEPGDAGNGSPDAALAPWMIGFTVLVLGFFALYLLLPIMAGIACALGKDYRYPIMGDRLARYLGYDPLQKDEAWLIEDHELRWIAAAGHFSVLIMLWGILAPLTAWMLYGKRSPFLRFQSIQTLLYQAGVTILLFAGIFLYTFGVFALAALFGALGQLQDSSSLAILGMAVSAVLLAIGGVILLIIPLLHILGQWAGYRVLKGDDYHYPVVGRLVEKWISRNG